VEVLSLQVQDLIEATSEEEVIEETLVRDMENTPVSLAAPICESEIDDKFLM
jgi:hypothetical protein